MSRPEGRTEMKPFGKTIRGSQNILDPVGEGSQSCGSSLGRSEGPWAWSPHPEASHPKGHAVRWRDIVRYFGHILAVDHSPPLHLGQNIQYLPLMQCDGF